MINIVSDKFGQCELRVCGADLVSCVINTRLESKNNKWNVSCTLISNYGNTYCSVAYCKVSKSVKMHELKPTLKSEI